jgi:uncharacterized iron-regulated membrane protein
MDTTVVAVLVVLAVIMLAAGIYVWTQRRRSYDLRRRFSPEYERALEKTGDQR